MHSVATRELVHLLHKRLRSCHPFLRPEARKRAVVSTVTQCHFFSFRSNATGVQRKDNIGCDHFAHLHRVCCVCRTEYDDAHGRTRRADFLVGKQLSGSYPCVTNAVIHNTFKDRFVRPLSVSRCIPKLSGPSMEDGRLPRLNKAPPEVSNLIIYLCLLVCSGRRRRRMCYPLATFCPFAHML